MKQTKIKYKLKGDLIEIVSIENSAVYEQIKREFGKNVHDRYVDGYPRYSSNFVVSREKETATHLTPGYAYTKERFSSLILDMKAAGARLQRIVREEKENKIGEVLI